MQLEAVHLKKKSLFFFFKKKRLQHYEGEQRTILKTKGLLFREEMYCLDYIQYIICFLFFVNDCKLCAYHHL